MASRLSLSADKNVPLVGVPDSGHRRADIQGLRAIAVLLVVLFHTGLVLDSGFVGVDIFFVISGYVITAMLWRGRTQTGTLGLRSFYVRRFWRLVPALSLTTVITLLVGSWVFSPIGTQKVAAQTTIGGMLLASNLVIERVSGTYFGVPAEANPLLNLWSLSVEEQFYMAFPVLLAIALLLGRARGWERAFATTTIAGITLLSFGFCLLSARGYSLFPQSELEWLSGGRSLGFYSPLTRAWEFGVGALTAALVSSKVFSSNRFRPTSPPVATLGVVLLALSLMLISRKTPFPSAWTVLPVLGTALVILAGSLNQNWLTRFLGGRLLQNIGDRSYSIYLWNWPTLAIVAAVAPASNLAILVGTLVGVVVAFVAYRLWENPLRKPWVKGALPSGGIAACIFLAPMLLGTYYLADANKLLLESKVMIWSDWIPYLDRVWNRCDYSYQETATVGSRRSAVLCLYTGGPSQPIDVLISGDSHAEALYPGLATLLGKTYNVVYVHPNQSLAPMSPQSKVPVAVLAGAWERVPVTSPTELAALVKAQVKDLLQFSKEVIIVGDVPNFSFESWDCSIPAKIGPSKCSEMVSPRRLDHVEVLRREFQERADVTVVDVRDLFCDSDSCHFDPGGTVLFRDSHHLNPKGSEWVARRIAPVVERVLAGTSN